MKYVIVIVLVCLLLLPIKAGAYSDSDIWNENVIYAVFFIVEPTITIGWDAVEGATYYEWQALWVDPLLTDPEKTPTPVVKDSGSTTNTQVEIVRPYVGHIVFKVRSCNSSGCGLDWCYSTDSTCAVEVLEDQTIKDQAWMVYWRLSPVTGLGTD